jgi:1-deoxy-D-xylulose-5-phosphate reductoisomerase
MDRPLTPPQAHASDGLIRVSLLGSTGSIGTQTIDVIQSMPERFQVLGLAAGDNLDLLAAQASALRPRTIWAASRDDGSSQRLRAIADGCGAEIATMDEMAADPQLDVLVVGTAGRAGLEPTLTALEGGRAVALANKEVVVMAGHLVRAAADQGGGQLRPVDSEHSAIWQCLWGEEGNEIRRILLTASGGALRDLPTDALRDVTPEQALRHPTWNMGAKITIDSASLVNKGMETIEARWLFDVPYERVEVVQHPESIVHSLVEMSDGSVKAQLGNPDMRLPIQCALTYPKRLQPTVEPLDLAALGTLNFSTPDLDRYPGLRLCQEAGRRGGTYPCVMAAADEVAVAAFMERRIGFTDIPRVIGAALDAHENTADPDLETIDAADIWARDFAESQIRERTPD